MQIISRFEHGSTLDILRLGPEDGHFAVAQDGYAFRRRTATPRNDVVLAVYATKIGAEEAVRTLEHAGIDMRILSIAARDAYSGEHVMDYDGKGDLLEVALSISGSGVIGAGIDGLGLPQDHSSRMKPRLSPAFLYS